MILGEAQNTTNEQMKMFLTRLGYESKAVITGDVTQIDLPDHRRSGLTEAESLLRGIEGIAFCYFTEIDVVISHSPPVLDELVRNYLSPKYTEISSEDFYQITVVRWKLRTP